MIAPKKIILTVTEVAKLLGGTSPTTTITTSPHMWPDNSDLHNHWRPIRKLETLSRTKPKKRPLPINATHLQRGIDMESYIIDKYLSKDYKLAYEIFPENVTKFLCRINDTNIYISGRADHIIKDEFDISTILEVKCRSRRPSYRTRRQTKIQAIAYLWLYELDEVRIVEYYMNANAHIDDKKAHFLDKIEERSEFACFERKYKERLIKILEPLTIE